MTIKYNWNLVLEQVIASINSGCEPSFSAVSRSVGVPRKTLQEGLLREFNINNLKDFITLDDAKDEKEKISFTPRENGALEVEATGKRIKTLDDLIEAAKIDLTKWRITKWVANKWDVGAKTLDKHLTFDNGKIVEGVIDQDRTLTVVPLFQVKIWLEPITQEFSINSVQINLIGNFKKQSISEDTGVSRALIIPDIHFGYTKNITTGELISFHEERILTIILELLLNNHFDIVVYLGDILDLPDWTDKFIKSPEFYWTTNNAINEAAKWLTLFRYAAPDARHVIIPGNHDERFNKSVLINMPHAYGLRKAGEDKDSVLSIQYLLNLDEINVEYMDNYPNGELWLSKSLKAIHGATVRSGTGDTAKAIITQSLTSVIFGHVHRTELVSNTVYTHNGLKIIYGFCPGCACKIDGTVPGSKKGQNWQQGIGVVEYSEDDIYSITPMPVVKNGVYYKSKLYTGENALEVLDKNETIS